MSHLDQKEIKENLCDAGCTQSEVTQIIECIACNDIKGANQKITACRKKHLDHLHESQKCIDRLDYLSYHLNH